MMTTAAAITASADDTKGAMNASKAATYGGNLTVNDAIEISTDTVFTGIEEFVPGGKLYVPYIKLVANDLMGKDEQAITAGGTAVSVGDTVAAFETKAEKQTVPLVFEEDENSTPTIAGEHTETLTFTISTTDV